MKRTEELIAKKCYKDARNKRRVAGYLDRYSRMRLDKQVDKTRKEVKEAEREKNEKRYEENAMRFDK